MSNTSYTTQRGMIPCIKGEQSKGICTISSVSKARRQDWLVCPYRALSPELLQAATRRLFQADPKHSLFVVPAIRLVEEAARNDVLARLNKAERVFIYFDEKLGGELSIAGTDRSPEFSFDVTIFELDLVKGVPHIGRFAILEIQTTDFHGSYRTAVRNLTDGLRLHGKTFATTLQANPQWLSEEMQSPNIANVFKRTFYQMMFKFQLGKHARCAGCVLAIPVSVWDSWQPHLAAPALTKEADGTFSMFKPGDKRPKDVPAWIFVLDTDPNSAHSPSPLIFSKIIATSAPAASYYALEEAPKAALDNVMTAAGFIGQVARRLAGLWPDLAKTVKV